MKLLVGLCLLACIAAVYSGDSCPRQFGGFYWTDVYLHPVVDGNTEIRYLDCRVRRPSWSQCYGCPDFERWTVSPSSSWNSSCECCVAKGCQHIQPCAWCDCILTIVNGCVVDHKSDRVHDHPTLSDYKVWALSDCECEPCQGNGRKRRSVASSSDGLPEEVAGLPRSEVREGDKAVSDLPAARVATITRDEYEKLLDQAGLPDSYWNCEKTAYE